MYPDICYKLHGIVKHHSLPIAGVTITLIKKSDLQPKSTQITGANGEYDFIVDAEEYILQVTPSANSRFASDTYFLPTIVGSTTFNITLSLGVVLSGRIIGQEANIQPDIKAIRLDDPNVEINVPIKNDKYSVVLPRGVYVVKVYDRQCLNNDAPSFFAYEETVELDKDRSVDFKLMNPVTLQAMIVDSNSNPVACTKIALTPKDSILKKVKTKDLICESDEIGKFEVSVLPGNYNLYLSPPAGLKLASLIQPISINESVQLTFTLDSGYSLQGLVCYGDEAVPNISLRAYSHESSFETIVQTDEQGLFLLRLPEGTFQLSIESQNDPLNRGIGVKTIPWFKNVAVVENQELIIELESGHCLNLVVTDEFDTHLPNCKVTYGPYGKEDEIAKLGEMVWISAPDIVCGTLSTNQDGICEIVLPTGVYFFEFKSTNSNLSKSIRQLSINSDLQKKVRLSTIEPAVDVPIEYSQLLIPGTP